LLSCPYFHLTTTVPQGLRDLFRSHQKVFYDLLISLTAQGIMDVAANPRHLGAMPGILAVLHTWTGTLDYHPHVHCLVTGGGVSPDGQDWIATRPGFFLPVRVLSRHLRSLFQQTLLKKHPELFARVPALVWEQEWVVNCIPWGRHEQGVLDYLARYVFRIAITERRILAMDDQSVTFQYILPRGFHKVRYYGLWNPRRRSLMQQVRLLLQLQQPAAPPTEEPAPFHPFAPVCPHCGCDELLHVREIPRPRSRSP
jgi:hypothetical protein